jgi:hypothetical protein
MGRSQSTSATSAHAPGQTKTKAVVAGPAPEASDKISNKLALGAGRYCGTEKYVRKGEFDK